MKNLFIIVIILITFFSCKSPEARVPVSVKSGSFLKESAERNKKLNALEEKKIQSIMQNNPEHDYIASENGFWYFYTSKVEADTLQPQFGDIIDFDFNVSNLEGSEIYASENKTYVMDKEELFTGLREGLKLMKPTESVTFIFPSQIAYGYYGDDNKIGTNVPLICEVTLNTIIENND
ncbi:gliding motility-associated peptidyl-prolyl isomerase GldI [Winogradskyella alexanderae]|uniref:Peptidyl-prolyl cis-trans isomerase n=1 Tax=Winogradskyella alexanderae TaxID=2877123 RepID=A0ABS7XT70_9FLAO|nr:gliding motility-associated peptidyl-prolyl isomerase GldI [Winogradskyella alexanderae]MCA0132127.1 gliding motility-associated peptidyl-prolyl isomerase GldI [Winogradskyella alexanderae]